MGGGGRGGGGGGAWWLFALILIVHAIAVVIFTRGFLLTRTELPHHSHSHDIFTSPCFSYSDPNSSDGDPTPNPNTTCWTKPAVDRLVIIVLDALRFDFVAPSSCFPESKPWMDKLKVLQRMASTHGSSAQIFKAIADPPTTSLQRLKGLTTGGLPTFIDVGNSFGAAAIVEDNLIHQLVQNGKRVLMMGDDTWVQLFPDHFKKAYPYPSFNVKDLHTVDNGCIDHLLPSLYEEDWDVLIAHFLGVDHAGHIFGVDSISMIEKLEQYNAILEKVIEVLRSQSGPGGLHDNTFLLVMGDHGQTLNGDHGGGSAEEVETSMFAMNFKKPSFSVPSEFKTSPREDQKLCTSSVEQLDFAVTVSALLGVPFPFGSIGRVNPELYALGTGMWNLEGTDLEHCENQSKLEEWMRNYANVLCINSWQVKRYIDVYSASSVIGFSSEDLLHVSNLQGEADEKWLHTTKNLLMNPNENYNASLPLLKRQIDAYFNFLSSVIDLARSKWTEFNLGMMITGLGIMAISLLIHLLAIERLNKKFGISVPSSRNFEISFESIFALFMVVVRACSFLSNSYILEEGKVANFLLATTGIVKLRYAIAKQKMLSEGIVFLLLISILRFAIEVGLSKQAATSAFLNISPSWMLGIAPSHPLWTYAAEILPMLALIILAYLLYKTSARSCWDLWKYVLVGTITSYILIIVHWALESDLLRLVMLPQGIGTNGIPQLVYAIGFGQLLFLAFGQLNEENTTDCKRILASKTLAMVSACSSTIILLAGKQGSLFALAFIFGGFCIMRLVNIEQDHENGTAGISAADPLSVTQWSLFAVCLFFSTGHWCAFDGLRYGAAFVGFDEFKLIRQAILLGIDTFGFSHILPVFGLPFLVACQCLLGQTNREKTSLFVQLSQMYMMYGLITAATTTATILCVTIQRRHLMVWGLFAPKFVFDVVGLMLTDVLIFLASLYYFGRIKDENSKMSHKKN